MVYIQALLIFSFLFIIFSVLSLLRSKTQKNYKRIKVFERKILWKIPRLYNYIYAVSPILAKTILFKNKDKLIERELLILLDNLSSNLTGGISVTETISSSLEKIKPPLKNELSMYLALSKEHSSIKALEHLVKKTKNIFLKLLWIMLLTHYKSGGALTENIKKLYKTLLLRINIKERIKAQLIQTKVQLMVGTVLPYFLFLIMKLLYPYLIDPVIESPLGQKLLLLSFAIHSTGVYFFIKITKFDMTSELNYSMLFEYVSFSIRNGISITASLSEIKDSGILSEDVVSTVENSKSTSELIDNLNNINNPYIEQLSLILKRGHTTGIAIGDNLSAKSEDIIEKLEQRALRFQQIVPSKALIPLFVCIFPATYILIFTPIIVEIFYSQSF